LASTSTGVGLEEPDPLRLGLATENDGEIPPDGDFFTAVTEPGAGEPPSALIPPTGNSGFVAAGPLASPPSIATLTDPNDAQLNQTVAGPGDPAAPLAGAAEPSMLSLLAVGALMGGKLCRARGKLV
jgi:hypothetical protein